VNTDGIRGSQPSNSGGDQPQPAFPFALTILFTMTKGRAAYPSMICAADVYKAATRAGTLNIATDCEELKVARLTTHPRPNDSPHRA